MEYMLRYGTCNFWKYTCAFLDENDDPIFREYIFWYYWTFLTILHWWFSELMMILVKISTFTKILLVSELFPQILLLWWCKISMMVGVCSDDGVPTWIFQTWKFTSNMMVLSQQIKLLIKLLFRLCWDDDIKIVEFQGVNPFRKSSKYM